MTSFAFAASPGADDSLAFSWTNSFAQSATASALQARPSTSGKLGSPGMPPLNTSFGRLNSPLAGNGNLRPPRKSSLGSPVSPTSGFGAAAPSSASCSGQERLLPPFSGAAAGVDAFGLSTVPPASLRLEGFPDRFPVDYRRGSGSSYQSSSTVRSSGSSDFDGLGLVGPGLSSLSLSSDLSSASSPGPASPHSECDDMSLTPRLMSSPMHVDSPEAAPAEEEADPFESDDDLSSFLQSLPAWHGSSSAVATKDFKPADDDFYWQDLEDSVQIDIDSCPTTPRAGARARHPYFAGRSPYRSPGKPRRTSSINSYSSRRSSAYSQHAGYGYGFGGSGSGAVTPSSASIRSFRQSPRASRSALTLRQVPSVPPSPLATGKKGKGKGKATEVKKAKKVRPPLPEAKYTAEGFDATALDAFFGIRPKANEGVEIWRRGSASASQPLLGPQGDGPEHPYDRERRDSDFSSASSLSTRRTAQPTSPRRAAPPPRLDIAAAQRTALHDARVFPMSAGVPTARNRSISPVPNFGPRQSEGGLLLGSSAGSSKSRARANTASGSRRPGAGIEEEEHALRKKASLGSKLMKALYGSEARAASAACEVEE